MLLVGENIAKIIAAAVGKVYPNNYTGDEDPGPLVICAGDGKGEPLIDDKTISINGLGPDLDHESFFFAAERRLPYDAAPADTMGWSFCKTARKPYDVVVVASLAYLSAKWDFDVSSDGDFEDWAAGVDLANEVLGEPIPNPLIVEELVGQS